MNGSRLRGRALQALRHRGWAVLLLLLCVGGGGILSASPASAAPAVLGLCDPEAPVPDAPGSGVPGFFMDSGTLHTPKVSDPADPYHLYNDSGFSGLTSSTYDLGCSTNPENWGKTIQAMSDTGLGNKAVSIGQSATALADAADTRAWNPEWIMTLLGTFADKVMDVVVLRIVGPFLVVGLMLASVTLVFRARTGDTAAVAGGVAWAVFVILVLTVVVLGPLRIAATAQSAGGAGVSALNADENGQPGRAATEQIMYSVHYQGWLRRTFGTPNSETARVYGPQLLAASRLTRAEAYATNPGRTHADGSPLTKDEREQVLKDRKALLEAKAKRYEQIAATIKEEDPGAYKYMQGLGATNTGLGILEGAFGVVAAIFRLAVDLLLILCTIVLVALGIMWVVLAPFLVTKWGEPVGRGLLNGTGRAVAFVLLAALGSWLFGLWTQVSLGPAIPAWWSMVLLILGTIVFWSLIRPDRKALNLATMGHYSGKSRSMARVATLALGAYTLGRVKAGANATREQARTQVAATRDEWRGAWNPEDTERARAYRQGHTSVDPYAAPAGPAPDVYEILGSPRTAPTPAVKTPPPSMPIYTTEAQPHPARPPYGTPTPPPAGAEGAESIYQVTDRTRTEKS